MKSDGKRLATALGKFAESLSSHAGERVKIHQCTACTRTIDVAFIDIPNRQTKYVTCVCGSQQRVTMIHKPGTTE